jgi:hypothetical protein
MIIDNTIHIYGEKWNFIIGFIPVYWAKNTFEFHLGFFKIIKPPEIGMPITKAHYKGFWIRIPFRGFGISIHFGQEGQN